MLMITSYRVEAISILGREVMQPRGLIGLGKDSIEYSQDEIVEIMEAMADTSNYPIMVHCTQGKDRTGLVIMLLLLLVETPLDAISTDYLASEMELLPERESRLAELNEIGLSEQFVRCPPKFVEEVSQYINETYGGMEGYLSSIGVNKTTQGKVIENLLLHQCTQQD